LKKSIKTSIIGITSALLLGVFTQSVTNVQAVVDHYNDGTDEMNDQIYGKGNWSDHLEEIREKFGLDDAHRNLPKSNSFLVVHTNIGDIVDEYNGYLNHENTVLLQNGAEYTTTEPHNELTGVFMDANGNSTYDGHMVTYVRRDGRPIDPSAKRTIAGNVDQSLVTNQTSSQDTNQPSTSQPTQQEQPTQDVQSVDGTQTAKTQILTTPKNVSYVSVYAINGTSVKKVMNRALAPNSSWFSDKKVTINGDKYYRVATNEWTKANDVLHPQD